MVALGSPDEQNRLLLDPADSQHEYHTFLDSHRPRRSYRRRLITYAWLFFKFLAVVTCILISGFAAIIYAQYTPQDLIENDPKKYFGPFSLSLHALAAAIEQILPRSTPALIFPTVANFLWAGFAYIISNAMFFALMYNSGCSVFFFYCMLAAASIGDILSPVDMWIAGHWTRHRLSSFIPFGATVGLCVGWVVVGFLGENKIRTMMERHHREYMERFAQRRLEVET